LQRRALADDGGAAAKEEMMRLRYLLAAAGAAAAMLADVSASQSYPVRPVRMIVAQPAGGTMDANARALSERLERQLGQAVVIDNRGGANGVIAGEMLAKAPPDGHTLLYTTNSTINNQVVMKKPPFDVLRDFAPVTGILSLPGYIILVNPQVPARNVAELVAQSRKPGAPVNFGSGGIGNSQHLAGELLNARAGARMVHVPYKGFGQVVTGLLGNEVQVAFAAPSTVLPHIRAGRLRAIAYTGASRWERMPELPTVAESVPGYVFEAAWHGLFAPAGTPAKIAARLHSETTTALKDQRLRDFYEAGGYRIIGSSPAEFGKFVAADLRAISEIVRIANVRPE
jgi:tripartite-type tricarboxylate transporter receptor subunit TctC